jgi:putative DNA primase/helicase
MSHSISDATAEAVAYPQKPSYQISCNEMPTEDHIYPASMAAMPRWVCWRIEVRKGKPTKVPIQPREGQRAASDASTTWTDHATAVAAAEMYPPPKCEGVGFMLGDGFAGVDLDNCIDADGELKPWARPFVDSFAATYMEISPSGTGIKIFCRGRKIGSRCRRELGNGERIEMYDRERFFTVTCRRYGAAREVADMQAKLDTLYREQFGDEAEATETEAADAPFDFNAGEWCRTERAEITDAEIIARIMGRDREGKLWRGNWAEYGSQSDADLCLAGFIACQTNDRVQIDRIFRQSALMRPKWNEQRGEKTYGEMTIDRAMKSPNMAAKLKPVYPMTDMGNAEHFKALHGDDLRYVVEWKSWIVWDGRRWKIDIGAKRAEQRGMRFVRRDLIDHANCIDDIDKRNAALKWSMQSQQGKRLNIMLERAAALLAIEADQLDRNAWLFNCRNGTIDLWSGELRPHNRSDLITKLSPIEFDAAATCPTWDKFIISTLPPYLVAYIQKAVGYSMTGDCSEKACFMLIGPSNTGKSTFSDMVKWAMGDYGLTAQQTVVLQTDKSSKTNGEDEANLFGARYVSVSEPGQGQRWDEAKLKRMVPSNGSRIRGRLLFQNSFEFAATHKIWLDANHRPTVRGGTDDAVWNRIKLIPFDHVVKLAERDGSLPTKLHAEASGVLNWMIAGLKAWLSEGLAANEPQAVRAAVNEYRVESDLLGQFLRDCVQPNDAAKIDKQRLYLRYQSWCSDNGVDYPLNKINFGRQLSERGYQQDRGYRNFVGMELIDCADANCADASNENFSKTPNDDQPTW